MITKWTIVGEIIAKTHRLSVSHHNQLQDHEARLNVLANAAKSKSSIKMPTPFATTKKDITKAISQSFKKSLPKLSTMHAGHPMYLM